MGEKAKRAVFAVSNIDCATCAMAIEKRLRNVDGIEKVGSSIMLNRIFVDYDESRVGISEIMQAIKKAGYSGYLTRRMGDSQ
ncbi:MAG: heavy-metal-associated domain-containing protein [Thaumarchaeota archaeon]|nr:heavy-metal-associated domain-containing protein [Nitrososphaerota archaeon]